jgi:hypothetical protein
MGEFLVIGTDKAHPSRIALRRLGHCRFEHGIARTQHCQPAAQRNQPTHIGVNDIDALLPGQAADQPEQWPLIDLQSEPFGHGDLVEATLAGICGGIIGDERTVGLRIPRLPIDAVENAMQIGAAFHQQPFQSHAVIRGLDFERIGRAHRRNRVRASQPALEKPDAAVIFDPRHVESRRSQP